MSRGMKKFLPFASLKEQAIFLSEMEEAKKKVEKPLLSEDLKVEINRVLTEYNGELVLLYYYDDGFIRKVETTIKKIDVQNKTLRCAAFSVKFTNILRLEIIN